MLSEVAQRSSRVLANLYEVQGCNLCQDLHFQIRMQVMG